jgi:hypothetical protein
LDTSGPSNWRLNAKVAALKYVQKAQQMKNRAEIGIRTSREDAEALKADLNQKLNPFQMMTTDDLDGLPYATPAL